MPRSEVNSTSPLCTNVRVEPVSVSRDLRAAGWIGAVTTPTLDLTVDVATLTENLVDIESVSRDEQRIADAVEAALRPLGHLTVGRHGNTVVARTELGRGERVVIAGHLDTVPVND